MGDEDHPHGRKLLRRQGEGSETAKEKSDVFENRIRQDIIPREADPESRMAQIGDGVAPPQYFLYIRLEGLKNRRDLFLLFEGIGGKPPLQEPKESPRVFLGQPRVDEAGVLMVSFCPGEGLEVFRLGMRGLPKKERDMTPARRMNIFPSLFMLELYFSLSSRTLESSNPWPLYIVSATNSTISFTSISWAARLSIASHSGSAEARIPAFVFNASSTRRRLAFSEVSG